MFKYSKLRAKDFVVKGLFLLIVQLSFHWLIVHGTDQNIPKRDKITTISVKLAPPSTIPICFLLDPNSLVV